MSFGRSDKGAARVRLAAALLLAAGILGIDALWPERGIRWAATSEPLVDPQRCIANRAERESCRFTLPATAEESATWSQVAAWFRLDVREVCAANGAVAAEGCGEQQLAPGEAIELPLRHHRPGPPGRGAVENNQ